MDFHDSHTNPTAVRASDAPQSRACATSTEALMRHTDAIRMAYDERVRLGIAAAAGEVVVFK
jgi:hypothetical protein